MEQDAHTCHSEDPPSAEKPRPGILLVDDDPLITQLIVDMLSLDGQ